MRHFFLITMPGVVQDYELQLKYEELYNPSLTARVHRYNNLFLCFMSDNFKETYAARTFW